MKKIISTFLCSLIFLAFSGLNCFAIEVPANTSIYISPTETVTSKNEDINTINAVIKNNVVIQGKIIFKAGDKAVLNIDEIEKARRWGKEGKIAMSDGIVFDAKGHEHKVLIPVNHYYGEEKTWPKTCAAISVFFLLPLALFGLVRGGQATISENMEIETNLVSRFSF